MTKTKKCRGKKKVSPFLLLENSRPPISSLRTSPWGPSDFLSACLGIDSHHPPCPSTQCSGAWFKYVPFCASLLSHIQLFETPWTVAQVLLSMGFSRQEYLEWAAMPSSRGSSTLQVDSLSSEPLGKPDLNLRLNYIKSPQTDLTAIFVSSHSLWYVVLFF